MKNLDYEKLLPERIPRDKVRPEIVRKHAPLMAKRGIIQGMELLKDKATPEEKLWIELCAVELAYEDEIYSNIPELAGACLYGFASLGWYDLAKEFIEKSMDPAQGGTSEICNSFLLNLSWLSEMSAKTKTPEGLTTFIGEAKVMVLKQLESKIAELYRSDQILKKRAAQIRVWDTQYRIGIAALLIMAL